MEAKSLTEQIKKSSHYTLLIKEKKKAKEQVKEELGRTIYLKTSIYEDLKQGILTREEFLAAKEKYTLRITELEEELYKRKRNWKILNSVSMVPTSGCKPFFIFREQRN